MTTTGEKKLLNQVINVINYQQLPSCGIQQTTEETHFAAG